MQPAPSRVLFADRYLGCTVVSGMSCKNVFTKTKSQLFLWLLPILAPLFSLHQSLTWTKLSRKEAGMIIPVNNIPRPWTSLSRGHVAILKRLKLKDDRQKLPANFSFSSAGNDKHQLRDPHIWSSLWALSIFYSVWNARQKSCLHNRNDLSRSVAFRVSFAFRLRFVRVSFAFVLDTARQEVPRSRDVIHCR